MKKSPLRVLAVVCITAVGLGFVAAVFCIGLTDKNAAERDFISYWAAGQQLMHGANPYDLDVVQGLERAVGRKDSQLVLTMRNPPIAFFLAWPLGLVSPKTGLIVWLFVLLGCLVLSVRLLWLLNGRPASIYHLLCFLYAPVLSCMMAGQFGIFLLLGVVLFLYFQRSWPFVAGAALLLCALKPHLFLPFGVVLMLWTLSRRSYRVLLGFSAAFLASCALSYSLDPQAWSQYNQMMRAGGALGEKVPALSVYFRFLVDRNAVWLQFLPLGGACVWGIWYFWTRRAQWNWLDHGLVLLLVGAMCTPFGWFTDESMLLPAVLAGLYRAESARRSVWPLAVIAGVALIEVIALVPLTSRYFLWTTPAWLGWYLYATGRIWAAESKASDAAVVAD
jgi:hypothetical protein